MRNNTLIVIGVIGVFGLGGAVTHGQQAGRNGGAAAQPPAQGRGAAAPVPDLPIGKTAFWTSADIQARWKDNEVNKRINSRLFNGPTNISANVRIVLPGDPPVTHETTADLWIVTEGTAIARTDGQIVDTNGTKSVRNGVERPVSPGDILYVPPGVPHHFTDMKGFRAWLMRFDTVGLVRTKPAPAAAAPAGRGAGAAEPAGRGGRAGAAPAPPVPDLPKDKTLFWKSADIQARWKDNEANKRINSRLYNGPANISMNVRIVLDGDPPATHEDTADLWLVTEGTATARTDGEIVQTNGKGTIRNGVQRPVHPGDLLYVPPGVPHHFTDMKGFRAFLIRYDVVGWRQNQPAAQ
jgi:mannose-6-phosphate isomerase-like protein (cupin superfamily)